jgi:hypothetical protein
MSFTIGDIQAQVQARGYGSDTAAQQLTAAQAMLRRLYTLRRWAFMESTTAAAATYNVPTVAYPAGVDRIDAVRLSFGTTYTDLDFMSQEDLRALYHVDRVPDEPQFWTIDRGEAAIMLYPAPNKAYTVNFDTLLKATIPADEVTNVPYLPDEFQDIAVAGVCAEIAARQRDWNAVNYWRDQYQTLLTEATKSYAVTQRQSAREVGHWDGWEDVAR